MPGPCSGGDRRRGTTAAPALTDWLHEKIQELAGLKPTDDPLTFGMLRDKPGRSIRLAMVSTNLTQGQPYDLPFDQKVWVFREEDMKQLFPEPVVKHLVAKAHRGERVSLEKLPGYYFLPEADDLPVVVAMRMSLSFPVLICAVPLYAAKHGALSERRKGRADGVAVLEGPADLEKNWFSDGGISSNFPIHFFDDWLPGSPTFGINLRSMPPERSAPTRRVWRRTRRPGTGRGSRRRWAGRCSCRPRTRRSTRSRPHWRS